MTTPDTRLIESAFPLRQVSRASVHEKSVRHGHVSTLHVWPARRPLAASRAAVLAALLPAPGGEDERRRRLARMAATLPWGGEDPAGLERSGAIRHWRIVRTARGKSDIDTTALLFYAGVHGDGHDTRRRVAAVDVGRIPGIGN